MGSSSLDSATQRILDKAALINISKPVTMINDTKHPLLSEKAALPDFTAEGLDVEVADWMLASFMETMLPLDDNCQSTSLSSLELECCAEDTWSDSFWLLEKDISDLDTEPAFEEKETTIGISKVNSSAEVLIPSLPMELEPSLPTKPSAPMVDAKKVKKRVRQPDCRCPYCIVEGGNKTRGANGRPQHICHFPECRKIFGYAKSLYRHLRVHENQESFVCSECNKNFSRKDSFKAHVAIHIREKRSKGRHAKCECANCINGGMKSECLESKWKYACTVPHCGKAYTRPENLRRHQLSHDGKKNFVCDHCNKGFERKDLLIWHMKTHATEDRKWARCRCPNCSVDVKLRRRAPNGKLLHLCHIAGCKKVYTSSWQLKRHLESHSAKESYACPKCNKKFVRQDSFDRHVKRCVKKMKNEGFARKTKLREQAKSHVRVKQEVAQNKISVKPYVDQSLACSSDGCKEVFYSIRLLAVHLKSCRGV